MSATPPSDPAAHGHGTPLALRLLSNPLLVATVVAFGPSLLLLYTAAVEWPRQAERFHDELREQREQVRELRQELALMRSHQEARDRARDLEAQQHLRALQGLQKVLQEMWWQMQAEKKKHAPPEEASAGPATMP